jgi:thioredoxin 1
MGWLQNLFGGTPAIHPHPVRTLAQLKELVDGFDGPVLVDVWSPNCGPCRKLGPVMTEVATKHDGRARVAEVDVTAAEPALVAALGVMATPTVIIYDDGEEFGRVAGFRPPSWFHEMLDAEFPVMKRGARLGGACAAAPRKGSGRRPPGADRGPRPFIPKRNTCVFHDGPTMEHPSPLACVEAKGLRRSRQPPRASGPAHPRRPPELHRDRRRNVGNQGPGAQPTAQPLRRVGSRCSVCPPPLPPPSSPSGRTPARPLLAPSTKPTDAPMRVPTGAGTHDLFPNGTATAPETKWPASQ